MNLERCWTLRPTRSSRLLCLDARDVVELSRFHDFIKTKPPKRTQRLVEEVQL